MPRPRRTTLTAWMAILTLLLAACGSAAESEPPADGGDGGDAATTVSLSGARFSPSTLTIAAGETVTFTDTSGHTVTEGTDGVAVEDPVVNASGGGDHVVTFDEPGTYNITCTIHPSMNMTITVEG